MNRYIIIALVWIIFSVYNYVRYIPQNQKDETSFLSFVIFATVSPLITLGIYFVFAIKWLFNQN